MAVSGIDHTIKIFSPDANAQRSARKGVGVQSSDPDDFSSLNWSRRRRTRSSDDDEQSEERPTEVQSDSDDEVAPNGLRSRKRMHEAYQITSQNDMDRKGGREDYFISVSANRSMIGYMLIVYSKLSLRNWLDTLRRIGVEVVRASRWWLRRRTAL
jgi:hypothetical protein